MFDKIPTYDKYRTLQLQNPMMGPDEDVWALQKGINSLGFTVVADGYFGPQTDKLVRDVQRNLELVVDGKAGGMTQKQIALVIAISIYTALGLPNEAARGQLEHESGFRLGIYSPARPDGSYDAGVAQRNTNFHPPKESFNPEPSIRALAQNTRKHYDLFEGLPKRRRMALAQGAWNAPAFACYLAKQEGATKVTTGMIARPSSTALVTFEAYVSKVSQYLTI